MVVLVKCEWQWVGLQTADHADGPGGGHCGNARVPGVGGQGDDGNGDMAVAWWGWRGMNPFVECMDG